MIENDHASEHSKMWFQEINDPFGCLNCVANNHTLVNLMKKCWNCCDHFDSQ